MVSESQKVQSELIIRDVSRHGLGILQKILSPNFFRPYENLKDPLSTKGLKQLIKELTVTDDQECKVIVCSDEYYATVPVEREIDSDISFFNVPRNVFKEIKRGLELNKGVG